jgi:hypothetical protein
MMFQPAQALQNAMIGEDIAVDPIHAQIVNSAC